MNGQCKHSIELLEYCKQCDDTEKAKMEQVQMRINDAGIDMDTVVRCPICGNMAKVSKESCLYCEEYSKQE